VTSTILVPARAQAGWLETACPHALHSRRMTFIHLRLYLTLAAVGITLLLAGAAASLAQAPIKESSQDAGSLANARRAADAARRENARADSAAAQADQRLKRAEDALKAAQSELEIAHREQRAAQQRLSSARSADNRAQRDLDAALAGSR